MEKGRLADKVAIIAGAASTGPGVGIGKATAIQFAREGAKLVLVNRTPEKVEELADEIAAVGGECLPLAADVSQESDVQALVEETVSHFGRLDSLINNVGVGAPGTVQNLDKDDWDNAMNTNLWAPALTSKYCIPSMIDSGGGSIINISTLAAVQGFHRGTTGFAPYAASKAGLIGLTLATAADYASEGVRANCLIVGMVNTPALAKFGPEAREKRRLAVPLQTEGTAWDVAWANVFLASDEARWITGSCLPIDGGQMSLRQWPG